jgi:hypothetical protein
MKQPKYLTMFALFFAFAASSIVYAQEATEATGNQKLSPAAESANDLKGPPGAPQLGNDALARELSNPTTSLASLANKIKYTTFKGDLPGADDQDAWTYTFQPVLPFPQSNGYNLIFRPGFPVLIDQPSFDPAKGKFDTETGLGDISFDLVYGKTLESGFLWSAGIFGVLPTATDDALGADQWKLGPDIVLGLIKKWGVLGILYTHVWDVAGEDDFDTSFSSLQYFYFFSIGGGWQIGAGPTITYDWEADSGNKLTLPVGLGVAKTTKIGNTPLKLALQVFKTVESPDDFGSDWSVELTVTPVIKNPFVKN